MEAERILSSRRAADLLAELREQNDLARLKIVPLVFPSGSNPPALAFAVWDPHRQEGELAVCKLPLLAPDRDYQFWITDPQYPDPVSAGVFAVPPSTSEARIRFKPDKPVTTAARFAISVERKGGVPHAEGPIVLSSQ
jgi:anti-sigma-K factor RskA